MTSIVRKDSGADWKTHRKNFTAAEGIELSWRADAARFDQQRAKTGKKKCSHDDWLSPSDPDGRITKLTAGSTDLADKANAVDLDTGLRTYISEPLVPQGRTWIDKAVGQRDAFRVNHCRIRSERGKRLLRRRGTVVERTFAHLCETGSGLRTWRRGLTTVTKRYQVLALSHNRGLILRNLCGAAKPRAFTYARLEPWSVATGHPYGP